MINLKIVKLLKYYSLTVSLYLHLFPPKIDHLAHAIAQYPGSETAL